MGIFVAPPPRWCHQPTPFIKFLFIGAPNFIQKVGWWTKGCFSCDIPAFSEIWQKCHKILQDYSLYNPACQTKSKVQLQKIREYSF